MPSFLSPRVAIFVVSTWIISIISGMIMFGYFDSTFFRFGPGPDILFFKHPINTWLKWSVLNVYIIINQLVMTYALQTITPWMLNTVENRAVYDVGLSDNQTQLVIQIWYIYLWVDRIISIWILFMQIDFLVNILIVNLLTTFIVNRKYLKEKKYYNNGINFSIV